MNGKVKLVFDPETLKDHRWSEEAPRALFPGGSTILAEILKERDEIRKRANKYLRFK